MIDTDAGKIDSMRFWGGLALFYLFFSDAAYRSYYFYQGLCHFANTPLGYLYALIAASVLAHSLYLGGIIASLNYFRIQAREIGWRPVNGSLPANISFGALIGLLAYFINVRLISGLLYLIQGNGTDGLLRVKLAFRPLSDIGDTFTLATILNQKIFAPVLEEIAFRGLLYGLLKRKLGQFNAVILTSCLFSMIHLTLNKVFYSGNDGIWALNQFFFHFVGGMIYNLIYIRTGSLSAPVSAHISYNFAASFVVRTIN